MNIDVPEWIGEFVANHGSKAPQDIEAAYVVKLGATTRHEALLDDRGGVWIQEIVWMAPASEHQASRCSWTRAQAAQAIGAIKLGSKRFPELAELLSDRPDNAADCAGCSGTGDSPTGLACRECFGLGWIASEIDRLGRKLPNTPMHCQALSF